MTGTHHAANFHSLSAKSRACSEQFGSKTPRCGELSPKIVMISPESVKSRRIAANPAVLDRK